MAVKNITKEAYGETSENDYYPPHPDADSIISVALNDTVDEFIKAIAPYTEYVNVEFAPTDSNIPEIESGINFCKIGRWDDGIKQFLAATKKNPMSENAWFNLGIAYEYNYMFDKAEAALMQANSIKPNDRCIQEMGNIRRMKREQKQLNDQGVIVDQRL